LESLIVAYVNDVDNEIGLRVADGVSYTDIMDCLDTSFNADGSPPTVTFEGGQTVFSGPITYTCGAGDDITFSVYFFCFVALFFREKKAKIFTKSIYFKDKKKSF